MNTAIKNIIHTDLGLTIAIVEGMPQAEIRAKSVELGAPIGKTSLSNLLNGKVESTGGWSLVTGEVSEEETGADQQALDLNASPAAVVEVPSVVVETPAPVAEVVVVPPVEAAPVSAPAAEEAPAPAKPASTKPAASTVPRFERQDSIDVLMKLSQYEPILKEAPTETYITMKLKKARVQATVGVRGVTIMLFPLKGLVLQEISDKLNTGWVVKAQYAKVGVFAPEKVAEELVKVEAEIAKLA